MLMKQRRLAGALLLSLSISTYTKYSIVTAQTTAARFDECENPREELKNQVQISAGGPYVTKVGVPITLHGTYLIAGQTENSDHLMLIGQALQGYLHDHGSFPPAALQNAKGQSTVSWRVLILPYLGEKDLYDRFDLSKSWNDPVNRCLLKEMPAVYRKSGADYDTTETGFAGVQGVNSLFQSASAELSGGRPLSGITASERIAAGPVGEDVHLPWTAPGDIDINQAAHLGSASGFSGEGRVFTPLLFLNGSVYVIPNNAGAGAMNTWTHIAVTGGICPCAPPSSLDAGLRANWELGRNGTSKTQGWDVTFLASQPGIYTVTLYAIDNFGNQYQAATTVRVR